MMKKFQAKKKLISGKALVFLTSSILLFACVLMLVLYFFGQAKAERDIQALAAQKSAATPTEQSGTEEPSGEILPEYQALYELNQNLAGWITIPDTNINYPVMQLNNEYYLDRNFNEEYSAIGLPFLDERCDLTQSASKLIYGHNTKSGALFHDLLLYEDAAYLKEHATIYFSTLYERGVYQVTSAESFEDRDLQPELEESGDTLMLITCDNITDAGRFAVYAQRVLTP